MQSTFIRSKSEAISKATSCAGTKSGAASGGGPWEITEASIQTTLNYLFDKLSHQCYMVCIKDGEKTMYKLIPGKTSPEMQKALKDSLQKNRTLTTQQRGYVASFLMKPFRIMQCILKPYTDSNDVENNEYMQLIRDMNLPDGVFIFNLTDAVILRDDRRHPFPYAMGNADLGEYAKGTFLPIFSTSGAKGYSDVVIPNYDDVFVALGKSLPEFTTEWSKKTIAKAVFRGGPSGCGFTPETNQRLKLAAMKSDLLDAEITGKGATIDSKSVKFDPKLGLGMMNTGQKPGSFMSMEQQSLYKYIVHVDGNVNAYRLLTTMASGSLILRVESEYTSWADSFLTAGKHYLSIKSDLSDLVEKIEWCKRNDSKCKTIAERGMGVARKALTREFIQDFLQKAMWSTVPKGPAKKTGKKTAKKEDVPLAEPNAVEDVQEPQKKTKKTKPKANLEPAVEPSVQPMVESPAVKHVVAPAVTKAPTKMLAKYVKLAEQRKKCIQTYRQKFALKKEAAEKGVKRTVTRKKKPIQKIEETI
jgi:hypothetical protein